MEDYKFEKNVNGVKICIAFSGGGHYLEAMKACKIVMDNPANEIFFLTCNLFEKKAWERPYYYVAHPEHSFFLKRLFVFFINFIDSYKVYMKEKPDIIISTGADVTLSIMFISKIFNKKVIFIESGANVTKPSMTGRIVYYISDIFIIQWLELQSYYPKGYFGNNFTMIFITVGTANKGFDRLIKACDEIAAKHIINFFAQIGNTGYRPINMLYKEWLTVKEINLKYQEATTFIVHGGFGTLSEILRLNKPIIVVPRSLEKGEAVNDQNDISFKLDKLGYIKCITDLNELESVIKNIHLLKLKDYKLVSDIPEIVNSSINKLLKK